MLSKDLAVVVIHGLGSQKEGFANSLISEISARVDDAHMDSSRIAWKQVLWSDITQDRQDAYFRAAVASGGLEWRRSREFVVSALGDASAYQKTGGSGTYERIHTRIADAMRDLYVGGLDEQPKPLIVLAHSLGGHIVSNYIWDLQHPQNELAVRSIEDADQVGDLSPFERMDWLAGMVTFGCNIPLFTFAFETVEPIRFPPPRLKPELKTKARWLNFFDPDDILGYPLKPLSDAYRRVVDVDQAIEVGGFVSGRTPASHGEYWTDKDLMRPVAELVKSFL